MTKRTLVEARALITGASSGIGRAIAIELARQHARLVIVARREEPLANTAEQIRALGASVELVAADITEPSGRQQAMDTAIAAYGGLDLLVNNAGIGAFGLFEDAAEDRLRRIMEVNFFALVEMTRLALPVLRRGVKPMVVNISSLLGLRAAPRSPEYCASKFAVQGFSEAVRVEWMRHGIDVLVVCPGTTQTDFTANAMTASQKPHWSEHPGVSAEEVARKTVRAIRAGKRQIAPFPWAGFYFLANRLAPGLMDRILARYV